MPTISVTQQHLFSLLNTNYNNDELDKLLFDFGLELDAIESNEEGQLVYKIEVPANRHDLQSTEGLALSLLVFQEKLGTPKYTTITDNNDYYITVDPKNLKVRPYIFGAVLKGVEFTPESLSSFINFQEKLHQNICRNRSIVAVGTHDLDTIKPPFTYTGELPTEIDFIPLTETTKSFRGDKLLEHYKSHKQLKSYVSLLENSTHYPIVKDSNGVVCSLPPIINSNHTRITLNTKNIFIDITCTNKHKGKLVLQQLVAAFSSYANPKYHIHTVQTRISDKGEFIIPKQCSFTETEMSVSLEYLKSTSGIDNLKPADCCKLLNRMLLSTSIDGDNVMVKIPINRSDIHSRCDIAEDLCIAYGYNNITKKFYPSGNLNSITIYKNELRKLMSLCQYKEVIMPILSSQKVESTISTISPVTLLNSNVQGIDIARTMLTPGLLIALNSAKRFPLPLRIFEIGDVCIKNDSIDVRVVNVTKFAAATTYNHTAGLEEIQGVLECVMNSMGYASKYQLHEFKMLNKPIPFNLKKVFDLKEVSLPYFLEKRCVKIIKYEQENEIEIGVMGVIHPDILKEFELTTPVSLFEITL